MFDSILDWFDNALNWVIRWFSSVYQYGHVAWLWVAGAIFSVFTMVTDTTKWVGSAIHLIASSIDAIADTSQGAHTMMGQLDSAGSGWPVQALELANYVSPVTEGFNCIVILGTLWIVCSVVRIIKSWIPTVS